jgi:hypothetical protein
MYVGYDRTTVTVIVPQRRATTVPLSVVMLLITVGTEAGCGNAGCAGVPHRPLKDLMTGALERASFCCLK